MIIAMLTVGLPMTTLAQPAVTFEFEKTMGQRGFYQRDPLTEPVNANPPTGFTSPSGVDFQRANRIIVADRGNNKLQSCDDEGDCYWIGGDGAGGGEFSARNFAGVFDLPHGVEVVGGNLLLVADEDNHFIQICDDTGGCKVSGQTGNTNAKCSSGLGNWCNPQDTAMDSQGRVYGLDSGNNRIQIIHRDTRQFLDTFMLAGSGLGQINLARGIAIDKNDMVIIADTGNNRIQICDLVPNCTEFGSKGSAVGKFDTPVGVDVDALGRIWIADAGNHRVQVCDYSGKCVAFGEFGSANGQFNEPLDVAVHESGRVAVVDSSNDRIQFFRTEAAFQINAGLNDAWYNPATPGQGFFITVFPGIEQMFIANFTFDTELPESLAQVHALAKAQFSAQVNAQAILGYEGHRWLTGFGSFSGTQAVLDIELTSGGTFDSPVPAVTQEAGYGTFTVDFTSCSSGSISYEIPTLGLQGVIPIVRVAPDNIALCEALAD